jgi:1-Cys peroxiredoxin 6
MVDSVQSSCRLHPSLHTTELGKVGQLSSEFLRRGFKMFALSCDSAESHRAWLADIAAATGHAFPFPIIADPSREIAVLYGMMDPVAKDSAGIALTARAVFIMGPDKKLKASILYPASTGRNFNEILRLVDSLQLTANFTLATPVDWVDGEDCIIPPFVSHEDAVANYPKGFRVVEVPSQRTYLRYTPQPNKP